MRLLGWKLGYLLFWLYQRLLVATVRTERIYHPSAAALFEAGSGAVVVHWHQQLLWLDTWFFASYQQPSSTSILMSPSTDTALLAKWASHRGFGIIYGSSRRGGDEAMRVMAAELKQDRRIIITSDGPRGPVHVAKTGAIRLARATGRPVIPITGTFSHGRRLNTWDKLILLAPWSRVRLVAGEPMHIAADTPDSELPALAAQLSAAILALEQRYAY